MQFLRHRKLTAPIFIKADLLILFREISAVYCQSHKKHINEFCGQNAEFLNVRVVHMTTLYFVARQTNVV
jgi:hypothetical protein